ncbi:MAG: Bax inhibitor-1/YccA family protein [Clostridia bacterium]|nr:Bax inhibitor-1/YccA family protein [Clostridia bacterium]
MENTTNKFFTKTFFWMFLGLVGTAIVAAYTYYSGLWDKIAYSNAIYVVLLIELIAVLVFSFLFKKMSPTVAGIVYFIYAFINGVTLSCLFDLYDLDSIIIAFVSTAAIFGVLSIIGYTTKKDLSNWRSILGTLLIVGIIATFVNVFLKNTMLDIGLTWGLLILFFGITIYDINKLKQLSEDDSLLPEKLHIYGAFQLYLDFINIFIRILRIMGNKRN